MNDYDIARAIAREYCATLRDWFDADPDTYARIRKGTVDVSDACDDAQLAVDAWQRVTGTPYVGSWDDDQPAEVRHRANLCADLMSIALGYVERSAFDFDVGYDGPERAPLAPLPIPAPTPKIIRAIRRRIDGGTVGDAVVEYLRVDMPRDNTPEHEAWCALCNAVLRGA